MISFGATIGILGGQEAAKMAAQACATLGFGTHIFCPQDDACAFSVSDKKTIASYEDFDALAAFASSVDAIACCCEQIPLQTLKLLSETTPCYPNVKAMEVAQNRLSEKRFIHSLGIATTQFEEIESLESLQSAHRRFQTDCLLKACTGKGQCWIDSNSDVSAVWNTFETEIAILEAFVPFDKELSILVARSPSGKTAAFPACECRHKNGSLNETLAPAPIESFIEEEAQKIAIKIADSLNLVGLLAVEFFLTHDGLLLVNEIAPVPHHSYHWTLDASSISQFEALIRTIADLPIHTPHLLCPSHTVNLNQADLNKHLHNPMAKVHIYGMPGAVPTDKIGHVTILESSSILVT